jgi:hypothetical protein
MWLTLENSHASLEQTYKRIKNLYSQIDSYAVVKEVANYRNYWRPPTRINVILLAESHVYTSDVDFKIEFDYSNFKKLASSNYPKKFVRFVYCIGYSESGLFANTPLDPNFKNPGTWQYWKIFCACASESSKINYNPVLKGSTKNFTARINNKIALLEKLKVKGIWLVDSSIVGINKLLGDQRQEIITTSWNNYVKQLITKSKPKFVVCIGKTVWDVLKRNINKMSIPCDYIHQPQAHLTSTEIKEEHKKLQEICSKHRALSA